MLRRNAFDGDVRRRRGESQSRQYRFYIARRPVVVASELDLAIPDLGYAGECSLEIAGEIVSYRVQLNAHPLESLGGLAVSHTRARGPEQRGSKRGDERASVGHGREGGIKPRGAQGGRGH